MSKKTYPGDSDFARMKSLYGKNNTVSEPYDKALCAVCENGIFLGRNRDGILIFKGIPFAKPPIDNLRWKAPEPVDKSREVREAYYFGKSPIQAPWYSELASCYPQSEDCLYLNVWTDSDRTVNKPVMVFIHGGAFGYGGTSDPLYDGNNFVKAHPDVVLVTIAYRVGIMGFIDFSDVPGSEGYEDSCNLGLLDQVCALKWIQNNISSFGGDPDNVTIFGESAGGGSVSLLPVMDCAKGLFKRVIAESGSIALTYSKTECSYFTKKLLKYAKAENMQDLLSMTTDELYQVNLPLNEGNNFPMRDGRIIPEDLYGAYKEGKSAWVEMISGTNKDECRYWIGELGGLVSYAASVPILVQNQCKQFTSKDKNLALRYYFRAKGTSCWKLTEFENDVIFRVPAQEQLLLHADNGGKSYHYYWTYPSAHKKRGACHAVELSAVFNNPEEKIFTGGNYNEQLAAEVQQMWVNFAKTGNPSTENNEWPLYERDTKQTLVLDEKIHIKKNLLSRRTAVVEQFLKYCINGSYAKLDFNIPSFWIIGGIIAVAVLLIVLLTVQ